MQCDVIVVGARCAGSSTAMRFARSGDSVLLLHAASPADKLSTLAAFVHTELLTNHIGQSLHDEGYLDRALKSCAEDLERC